MHIVAFQVAIEILGNFYIIIPVPTVRTYPPEYALLPLPATHFTISVWPSIMCSVWGGRGREGGREGGRGKGGGGRRDRGREEEERGREGEREGEEREREEAEGGEREGKERGKGKERERERDREREEAEGGGKGGRGRIEKEGGKKRA